MFRILLLLLTLLSFFKAKSQDPQLVLQAWYWDYPKTANGYQWTDSLNMKAQQLALSGFTHVWIPPHAVASSGKSSNGYDPKDLFIGNQTTGFGSRASLDQLMHTYESVGIKPVADMIYNHRDGGAWENNPAVTQYIFENEYGTVNSPTAGNPYPNDRYRLILPIGGDTGIGVGDLYFKFSSKSQNFGNSAYEIYMYTNSVNSYNPTPIAEQEPNGGGTCGEASNTIQLATNFQGNIDAFGCTIDEIKLSLDSTDFDSAGDTVYIEIKNNGSYHDLRPYEVWSTSKSADVRESIVAQTRTDFSNLPSGLGEQHWDSFRPNNNTVSSELLNGDWNTMYFFMIMINLNHRQSTFLMIGQSGTMMS